MLCKLMKHRVGGGGWTLSFEPKQSPTIETNMIRKKQPHTTYWHEQNLGKTTAPQLDVMWNLVGWVGIMALSRSVEADSIRALVGGGASDISLISNGGRK